MVAAVISGIFVVVVVVMAVVVIVCLKMALHLNGQSRQPRTLQAKLKHQQALPPYTDPALQALVSVTWCSVSGFAAAGPVLCSGNGQYSKGTCQCYSGWKGAECDVPMNQCIDPACGGHGSCIDGNCVCSAGYKGEHCEEGKLPGAAGKRGDGGTALAGLDFC